MTTPTERYADLTNSAGDTDPAMSRLVAQLDRALQPRPAPPELRAALDDLLRQSATVAAPGSRLSSPSITTPTTPIPSKRPGYRRALSSLAALAAVLVLSLLATALFISHPRVPLVSTRQNVVVPRGAALTLSGISMVSSNEGWAAGSYATPTNADGTPTGHDKAVAVLFHYLNGVWTRYNVAVNTSGQPRLNAISMDSPSDGWAVGGIVNGQSKAILLHYDGHTWTQITSSLQSDLTAVQMLSATDGWALTGVGGDKSIYHYDGTSWAPQPLPDVSISGQQYDLQLFGISMTSPAGGWAVGAAVPLAMAANAGYPSGPPAGVILHYTGGVWKIQQILPGATLRAVTMDATGDGWVVGNDDVFQHLATDPNPNDSADIQHMLLLQYTGGRWVTVPVPLANQQRLSGDLDTVTMLSPTDGWITGSSNTGSITEPGQAANTFVLLHYNGAHWTEVATPNVKDRRGYGIISLSVAAANDVWVVGSAYSTEENGIPNPQGPGYIPTITPLILHYHDGSWTVFAS